MKLFLILILSTMLAGCPGENSGGSTTSVKAEENSVDDCEVVALVDETETADETDETICEEEVAETAEEIAAEVAEKEASDKKTDKKTKTAVAAAVVVLLTNATITLSETSHAYGAVSINSSNTKIITLTNSGGKTALSLTFAGLTAPYTVDSSKCGSSLAGGGACELTVTYAPEANGDHTDTLTVGYNNGSGLNLTGASQTTDLGVTGSVAVSISSISPTSGLGGQTLSISGENFSANSTVKIGTLNCPLATYGSSTLSCTIPNNTAGSQTVTVTDGSKTASSSFTYQNPASVSADTSSYSYDDVKVDVASMHSFTLTNSGDVSATSLSFSGLTAPYVKTGGTCGSSLTAGSTCTVEVTFTPTVIQDNLTDELKIDYHTGVAAATQVVVNLGGDGVDRVIDIELGSNTSFLRYKSGALKSAGNNYYGKLGIGDATNSHKTTFQTTSMTDIKFISAGGNAACVIHDDDTVSCFGRHLLPTNSTVYESPESTGESAEEVSVGTTNTIAMRLSDGTVKTIGEGSSGQLANNAQSDSSSWVTADSTGTGNTVVTKIAVGRNHILAMDSSSVLAAGLNDQKQVGTDSTGTKYDTLTSISGLSNIVAIDAGENYNLALDNAGDVYILGDGAYGVKGNGTTTDISSPLKIASGVSKMAAGYNHICLLQTDKTLRCHGLNTSGELGNNDTSGFEYDQQNPGLSNVLDVSCGINNCMAVTEDGRIYGWGANAAGSLGLGDKVQRLVPTEISGL